MQLEKHKESILPQILKIANPVEQAAVLFKEARTDRELSAVVVDHETHPTIHKIVNVAGKPAVRMFLVLCIEDCVKAIQVKEPGKDQILEIADELIKDHPTLKPEDYRIFFANVKKGKYGRDYNRFDISTVYQMLDTYLQDRADIFEAAIMQRKALENSTVRTGEADMRTLYNGVVLAEQRKAEAKRMQDLRQRAIAQWKLDYDLHFVGVEITPEADAEYWERNPLDEDYVKRWMDEAR